MMANTTPSDDSKKKRIRRAHKKSRFGCQSCKHLRIKVTPQFFISMSKLPLVDVFQFIRLFILQGIAHVPYIRFRSEPLFLLCLLKANPLSFSVQRSSHQHVIIALSVRRNVYILPFTVATNPNGSTGTVSSLTTHNSKNKGTNICHPRRLASSSSTVSRTTV